MLPGLSGWSDRGFVGELYPPRTQTRDFLAHYARLFPSIELNSTFYGNSRQRNAAWAAAVPDSFRFCPKLPREVTHDRSLIDVDESMERTLEAFAGFGSKLGRAWGTLAPSFGIERMPHLVQFLERWSSQLPLAIELRHPAWFSDSGASEAIFECFTDLGVTAIQTDVAGRRDVLHMRLTTPDTMLRFVGNQFHPTDYSRLDDWVERLANWREHGLERAFLYFHQKSDPEAVGLAQAFAKRFAERTGVSLLPELAGDRAPGKPPEQLELF